MKNRTSFTLGICSILLAIPALACSFSAGTQATLAPPIMPTGTPLPTETPEIVDPVFVDICSLVTVEEAETFLGGPATAQSYQESGGCTYALQTIDDSGVMKSLAIAVAQGEEAKQLTLVSLGMMAAFSGGPEAQTAFEEVSVQLPELTLLEVAERLTATLSSGSLAVTPYADLGDAAYWMTYPVTESGTLGTLFVVKGDVYVSLSMTSGTPDVAPDRLAPLVQTIVGRLPAAFYVLPKEGEGADGVATEEATVIP